MGKSPGFPVFIQGERSRGLSCNLIMLQPNQSQGSLGQGLLLGSFALTPSQVTKLICTLGNLCLCPSRPYTFISLR